MADREKVIKGLECHAEVNCIECPYRDGWRTCQFGDTLLADAIALLKEQEEQKFFVDESGKITPLPVVVRCKDCWKREFDNCPFNEYLGFQPDDGWYCADGEQKEVK